MKKSLALVGIILLINSCAVKKKPYYVFSHHRISKFDHAAKLPADRIEINIPSDAHNLALTDPMQDKIQPPSETDTYSIRNIHVHEVGNTTNEQKSKGHANIHDVEKVEPVRSTPERKNGDGLIYLAASLLGLTVLGATRISRPTVTKMTRWAKANPKKTQGIIAGMHLPLLGLGLLNGYNMYQMGYDTSDTMMYGFGTTALLGFLTSPFLHRRSSIALPKQVNRQRLAFLGITLSTLMMMVGFGNRIEHHFPNTRFAHTVQAIDKSVFYSDNVSENDAPYSSTLKSKIQSTREAKAGMSGFGAFILTLLLVILACAGICLVVGAVTGAFATGLGAVLAVIGGIVAFWLAISGIEGVSKQRKATKAQEAQEANQPKT